MIKSPQAMNQAILLGLLVSLFGISTAMAAPPISGSGGTGPANFICNTEIGLCECEGDKSSVDCQAMRRNCKNVDDIFSTESPADKGKLFCGMAKQGQTGTKPGSGRLRGDVQRQAPAAAADAVSDTPSDDNRIVSPNNCPYCKEEIEVDSVAPAPSPSSEKPSRDPQAGAGTTIRTIRDHRVERTVRDHRTRGKNEVVPITRLDCLVGSEKLRRSGYDEIVVNECEGPQYTYTARSGTGIFRALMDACSGTMTMTYLGIVDPN